MAKTAASLRLPTVGTRALCPPATSSLFKPSHLAMRAPVFPGTPLRSTFSRIYALTSNDIKVGTSIEVDGAPWRVIEFLHVKPGKGAAFVRTKVRNYITGNTVEKTFRAGSTLLEADVVKETKQFTYKDGSQYVFMDLSSYEETRLSEAEIGDKKKWLKEGLDCNLLFWNGRVIDFDLPITVKLKIVDVDPGLRGDTAQGGSKPATLDTGAVVNVPLFVNTGEEILVDTRSGEYMSLPENPRRSSPEHTSGLDVDGVFNRNKAIVSALSGCLHFDPRRLTSDNVHKLPIVIRWIDCIQSKVDFGGSVEKLVVNKPEFDFSIKKAGNSEETVNTKRVVIEKKVVNDGEASVPSKGTTTAREQKKEEASEPLKQKKAAKEEKKKAPEKESAEKDAECSVSILNIQIGIIRKASKHPSADSLLVEEIDLGDGNLRQVISGLAKFFSPEDLINRRVVLITNVKPGKLRDVMSAGLVLCASNQDHTVVEPLIPPEGATLGERVSFSGYDGKPEDVLNPKKKQFEKITPYLCTDDKGVATFKGIPFMTSAGPCTSSIPNASVN